MLPGHIDLTTGPDGNTIILDAPQGLVVVDTGRHIAHVDAILAHAKAVGKPIIAVINTHWHLDHATGNLDILAAYPKAKIMASNAVVGALQGFLAKSAAQTRQRLQDKSVTASERARLSRALAVIEDRDAFVPRNPVEKDTKVNFGGRSFELHLAPNAATEADIWIEIPDEKLVIAGDLVVSQFPFFDTGCEDGWIDALKAIDQASWETLIPGHGQKMDRQSFRRWQSAFTAVLACARSDSSASDCASQWEQNASGFFTESERNDVRQLAIYYIDEVLRAPKERRMAYCRGG